MYEYFCALIIGIVEGLTEYIPVSSTGHMIIVGNMINFTGELANVFDVFIQLGAILSVVVVYRQKFLYILDTHHWFRKKGPSLMNLGIAMLPACVLGYLCHGMIKQYLFGPKTVIIGLVIGGLFMIFAEKKRKYFLVENIDQITSQQAFKIGLFQCLSLWPGFSRSGSTIAGSLLVAKYLSMGDFGILSVGFITSFVVAYVSILWFLKFLATSTLTGFAFYRFIVAFVALIYFW